MTNNRDLKPSDSSGEHETGCKTTLIKLGIEVYPPYFFNQTRKIIYYAHIFKSYLFLSGMVIHFNPPDCRQFYCRLVWGIIFFFKNFFIPENLYCYVHIFVFVSPGGMENYTSWSQKISFVSMYANIYFVLKNKLKFDTKIASKNLY